MYFFLAIDLPDLYKQYPQLIDTWVKHPDKIIFPDGESYNDVQKRAWEWFESMLTLPQKAIVAVTHVDIIKMILFLNHVKK